MSEGNGKRFFKHKKTKDTYQFHSYGKIKHGKHWVASVNYTDLQEKVIYTMLHEDFSHEFEEV